MPSFPVNLHFSGRLVTIVGGGKVATRKAIALRAAGARVRVVAPDIEPLLAQTLAGEPDAIRARAYESGDADGSMLVIAATGDALVNARVLSDARDAAILCSDAGDPRRGDFTFPATLRMDDVTIAVDTGGASPAFAKRILTEMQGTLDPQYGRAAATLGAMREYALAGLQQPERSSVLREVAELPIQELAAMNRGQAQHCVDAIVQRMRGAQTAPATGTLVCASRASALALTQTRTVAAKLALAGLASKILSVTTVGDRVQDRSIAAIGAENIFVTELESALRECRAQYAVHSCKDLPSVLPPDMMLAAVSVREDARDAFCSERFESFEALAPGARIGTSSLRRRAQLLALRPDLQYVDIRGNVDTRLRKLREGQYDAIVLAMAGLNRLGVRAAFTVPFDPHDVVPAVGQGALAIEMRAADGALAQTVRAAFNDPACELAVLAERAALAALQGGCQAPIGIHARLDGAQMHLWGIVVSADGTQIVRASRRAAINDAQEAQALGRSLAGQLAASGAAAILSRPGTLAGKTILLPRTQERTSRIAGALESDGAEVIEWRAGEAASQALGERLPDMIVFPSSGSVQVAAGLLAGWLARAQRPAVAAMGPASAAAAASAGFPPDVTAEQPEIEPLLAAVRRYFQ